WGSLGIGSETKPGPGIDEVLDQPCGSNPVDLRARPSLPHAAPVFGFLFGPCAGRKVATGTRFEFLYQALRFPPLAASKEIDSVRVGQTTVEPAEIQELLCLAAARGGAQRQPHVPDQALVLSRPRPVEQRHHLLARAPMDPRSFHDGGVALILSVLRREPLEPFEVAGAQRQDVGAILPVQRSILLEPPPDTHALAGLARGE